MREVKCYWCKEKSSKENMACEAKPTGKFNTNGTEKMSRRYFHKPCHEEYKNDQEFKRKELTELDSLYTYLMKLHKIELLDGRMMERIQDLRNGTVKIQNKKIKKYKSGVSYSIMLETYQYIEDQLSKVNDYKTFETVWNEFAYYFSIMINKIHEVQSIIKRQKKQEDVHTNVVKNNLHLQERQEISVKKNKKKDELDISNFL